MYLTTLLIDVGLNPDRPRPGRLWLRNLYRVHQRLCMAFPSASRKARDPDFLKPFDPEDFGTSEPKQVHVERATDAGLLFRVDPQSTGRVAILVQSALDPDWSYAFHNARHLLAAPPQCKSFDPSFAQGQVLRFRLMANPTKRLRENSRERDGKPVEERWVGKRVPVPTDQLLDWLDRRAGPAGFSIHNESTTVQPGYVYVNKTLDDKGQRLRSARYDGILTVTDPINFLEALVHGIGPAKAFGFGLLSVARPERWTT